MSTTTVMKTHNISPSIVTDQNHPLESVLKRFSVFSFVLWAEPTGQYLRWQGNGRRWAASSDTPATTAESAQTPAGSPGRRASRSAAGGEAWRRGGTPTDRRCREREVLSASEWSTKLQQQLAKVKTLKTYLRFRPCMTASGPEDTGASWEGRQPLKSAHWTRESPLSAIRVLQRTGRKSAVCFGSLSAACFCTGWFLTTSPTRSWSRRTSRWTVQPLGSPAGSAETETL